MKYAIMTIVAVYLLTAYGCNKTEEVEQHVQNTEQTAVQQTGAEETLPVTDEIQDAVADVAAVEDQQTPEAVEVIIVDLDEDIACPAMQEAAVIVVEPLITSEEIQQQTAPVVPIQEATPGETPAPKTPATLTEVPAVTAPAAAPEALDDAPAPKTPAAMTDVPAVTAPAPAPEALDDAPAPKIPAAMTDVPAVTAPAPVPEALDDTPADAKQDKMVKTSPKGIMSMLADEGEKRLSENLKAEQPASEMDTVQTVQSGPACPAKSKKPCTSVDSSAKISDNKAVEVVVDENKVLKVKGDHTVVQTITKTTTTEKTGDKVSAIKQNVEVKTRPASPAEMSQALIEMRQSTSELIQLTNKLIRENKALKETLKQLQSVEQ
ncbi:hypothetical protein JWG39_10290 [Desulforhopalus vacuolatus]|uniref:hypothetical protein n=1 Tax=Desulforhopalus vacuolatus TaxID=40414 RepID=UPI001963C585|nr:hypothetical protein [Desulforhopalus vacuolatus]MBM9520202.1 hypothetical protein [Desulforhopalus vacuolatus]